METQTNIIQNVDRWIKNSVMLKLLTITIIMLLLLIPTSMVQSIIEEREMLSQEATNEVSMKWANQQLINGPILTIPISYEYGKDDKTIKGTKNWFVLPKTFDVRGSITPEKLNRGIFEIVVYESLLEISGRFVLPEPPKVDNMTSINYEDAFLTIGISDLRGIQSKVDVKVNKKSYLVNAGSAIPEIIQSGITVPLHMAVNPEKPTLEYSFTLDLQGSKNLSFIPNGSTSTVRLDSEWDAPSFNGNFLPKNRDVAASGFSANWKVLQLNRNYPESWIGNNYQFAMQNSAFGVELKIPVDDYQKSMRSSKYGAMTIALTFLIFFLVEIKNNRKIHPFQYALVGLALCLFYILLVSISEHLNFNQAFIISSIAVVSMVSLYSLSVFKQQSSSVILTTILVLIYTFLFVTLQLTDYALLLGSIGLALMLGATMYFTRNINWYKLKVSTS